MKSHRKELWFEIPRRRAFLNVTPEVEACLRESGIREGLCLVNAMHISASVFINDDESGLHRDFEKWLEKLAPEHPHAQYAHNGAEDNADAHLKRTRFRSVGADFLRRIRRAPAQARPRKNYRRVNPDLCSLKKNRRAIGFYPP
jgi:secondary thiamine-phosphate synthase enzyme